MDVSRNIVVGEVLACMRREHNLTQVDLAKIMGVAQPTISKTESGQRTLPLVETYLFCGALGEEPGTFIDRVYTRLDEEGLLPTTCDESESND